MVFVATLITLFVIKSIKEDDWICTENGWIEHGKSSVAKPTMPCGKTEIKTAVQNYLKENIFEISPQKEVLGGKFYITKIDWTGENSGIVEYEDGHIALKASFDYAVKVDKQTANYSIVISNFKIIE